MKYIALQKNTNPWTKKVKNILNSLGYSYLFHNHDMLKANLKLVKQRIKDICLQMQNSNLQNNSKLSFFMGVYESGERPTYVDKLTNLADRAMICRFRTSSHQLMIEKGRHLNILLEQSICQMCYISIEDEIHFLFDCSFYKTKRDNF